MSEEVSQQFLKIHKQSIENESFEIIFDPKGEIKKMFTPTDINLTGTNGRVT